MGKLKINYKLSTVGWSACGLLGLLMLVLVLPICTSGADAVQNSTSVAQTRAVVNAAATVSVALDSEVTIDVTPTGEGTFASTPTSLTVSTNNQEGYSLYLKTLDATNSMTSTDPNKTNTIQAVSGTPTSASFANNTWGYALTKDAASSATQYAAVPTNDTKIYNEPSTTTGDTYNLTFGAKVSTDLPAGQYANTVQVSVVANPNVISNLTQLVYMQDMTAGICANTGNITPGNEVSKQLIDIRDGKQYWVSKLADQNCWMTQNLALDLKAGQQLTSADTNLANGRIWQVLTEAELEDDSKVKDTKRYVRPTEYGIPANQPLLNQHGAESWGLGDFVLATPLEAEICNSAPTADSPNDDGYNAVRPGQLLDVNCARFRNVGTWKPTFEAGPGIWNNKQSDFVAINEKEQTYDAHYLIGNYYMWNTAIAGTYETDIHGAELPAGEDFLDAKESICPKGWTLPKAGASSVGIPVGRDKSFYSLLLVYGYPGSEGYKTAAGSTNMYTPILQSNINGASQNVFGDPMHLVMSGAVFKHSNYGALRHAGDEGYYWSGTAMNNVNAVYDILANYRVIYPSKYDAQYYGFTVRCLAR